ncbi:N-acetylmuramoyl-L-alanine amidase [Actinomadura sp. KC345]|uniref:N-acetylmuramoyl-L-alanine amidase n=1 Tax=Actinomadura sp. KC345 TaxID=2530371 RepID=UPI001A9F1FA3|nr:N-acetylmuramoyl-L-alanine amidase [Actinomadura sp. KC345]
MDIISRAQWGARSPRSRSLVGWPARREFIVHYSAGPKTQTVEQIQAFHMDGNGWSDVGYNFLVNVDGEIFEGRGWGVVGAHAPDHNTSGIGVCVIGRDGDATAAAKRSVRWLYDQACEKAGRQLRKLGHRDVYSTSCPGDELYAWVRAGMPADLEDDVSAEDVWNYGIKTDEGKGGVWRAGTVLGHLEKSQDEQGATLARLEAAVSKLAQGAGIEVDVDEDAIVAGVLAGLTPERIAAAIPPEIAQQVVTALADRLTPTEGS